MKISIFQKEVFSFNILKTVICSSKIRPKWAVIPSTQRGKQIGPYSQQLFLIKNPATPGFLNLQTDSGDFKESAFIPPIISIRTFQSQFPESIYHFFIHN
jgi:hypothetical protein